ncbi:hypothetical protein D9C73_021952 [Collichthys lucidus]|uniref:Uncharacterized protein n=1 Tax=Collichthys lucidus TaxID=240159 RepID=A0A4U5VI03_COLLU|nr:hypothetical protein D9C73_021952 [Collichthys lucidus]
MPVEGCHHRFHPKTSGIPGARPVDPGLSCRKPRVRVYAKSRCNTGQATLKLISSNTTLYGPIHLNQSCYLACPAALALLRFLGIFAEGDLSEQKGSVSAGSTHKGY